MTRCLAIAFALVACTAEPPGRPDLAGLQSWLDTWEEARQCLVASAPDSTTGLVVGELTGRDCARPLHQLELQVMTHDYALNVAWHRAIENVKLIANADEMSARGQLVDEVDAMARGLGLAIGRWIAPIDRGAELLALPDPVSIFGGKPVFSANFTGGYPHAITDPQSEEWGVVVDEQGDKLTYTQLLRDPPRPNTLTHADDETRRLLFWIPYGYAYAFDLTLPGKPTTTTRVKGRLRGWWQDARTGEVTILLGHDLRTFLHRFGPGARVPSVDTLPFADPHFEETCVNGGEVWGLQAGVATNLTRDADSFTLGEVSMKMHLDCRGATALVLRHGPDVIERCHGKCEEVFAAPTGHEGVAALLDDGRWIYAVVLDRIAAVWIEDVLGPQLFRMPTSQQLVAITQERGELMLVVRTDQIYSKIVVPPAISQVANHSQP